MDDSKNLIKNVAFTIIYYNVMDYPLTTFEVWKHLIKKEEDRGGKNASSAGYYLAEILSILETDEMRKNFVCVDSFWVLKGWEHLARERIKKQKISIAKIQRLKKWIEMAKAIPFLRGVFISGTLAMKRAGRTSDWDVILVMKKDRIWIGRLLVSVFFQFLGKRRHRDKITDRFCLNHFLSEGGLILEEIGLYSASELMFALPVYGREVYRKFIRLNEFQIRKFKPNYRQEEPEDVFLVKERGFLIELKKGLEWLLEKIFLAKGINYLAKKIMTWKIKNNPKTYLEGADIRYSDQALIFLPQPRRGIVLSEAEKIFKELK